MLNVLDVNGNHMFDVFKDFFHVFQPKIIDVRNSAIEMLPKPPYKTKSSHIPYEYGNMGV